ncbi:hypothetical protein L861_13965 [Litchfieldella anticariensis FP35 = DSM 16096]|uniref:Putative metallopeptidase domain-containing protein n=1 Tax=Litchfieldella anticariensis (strain DSM 16096 / CECT 5854 / CIP 108499 / LMG 22089 / FP35) TaxID=1121939 RepID=S2KEU3_LITA3|nr:hypothetical protein [Halomonas anticariensis]EPC00375.1 hypothetical protein L861_13965 [Halomonas anticariensis FP35 = DSM 16096]
MMAMTRHETSYQDAGKLKRHQQELWETNRATWRITHPFMADLADGLTLVPVVDNRLPSATTDGHSLFFNASFSVGLNAVTRRFLQAHLVWHCVLGDILPRQVKDQHRWHLACDHEVNGLLVHLGISLPYQAVLFFSQLGQPAKAVYDWLIHHPAPQLEQPLDRHPTDTAKLISGLDANHDDAFVPVTPDKALIHHWQAHASFLARDYRGTPSLPAAIDTKMCTLERRC